MISFIKFNIVGILNTILGYAIIFFAMYLGLGPFASNVLGYGAGLAVSYYLNRRWSFISSNPIVNELPKFFTVFIVCYLFNLAVLHICIDLVHISAYISQLISGVFYSILFYFLSKLFVFKRSVPENKKQELKEKPHGKQ